MSPLKSSTKVECMLCLLENIEEDKDGSVSQKKSCYKRRGKDFSQDRKDGGIRGGVETMVCFVRILRRILMILICAFPMMPVDNGCVSATLGPGRSGSGFGSGSVT